MPLQRLLQQTADAVQAVRQGRSLTDVLARCPRELRPGTQALSFLVLRQLGAAQALRRQLAPKAPPPKVENLLLCALALLWPSDDPPYAAHTVVDQTVRAVRQRAAPSAGFVNAVLRRFLREREALVQGLQRDPVAHHNHPQWWIDRVRQDWPQHWQGILAANNSRPPMTLRVNARQGSATAYQARLAAQGMASRLPGERLPQALLLERPQPVAALPGFEQGAVSVQDAAAQIAAPLTVAALTVAALRGRGAEGQDLTLPALPPGARVLDACSAPGGKTAHLLELQSLDLLALDADPERLSRVEDNLRRLQLQAQTRAVDARQTAQWWDGRPFDAILLDAPCSASGIVRRHPDVRWLRRPEDIPQLARIQAELLDALWPLLKPGGRLVYATCSLFKAEGQDQVDAFLQRQPDAEAAECAGLTGHLLPVPDNGSRDAAGQAVPLDGFFYALLLKSPASTR
ncbi:16S rRNA (cytosine(967)-C(5))-methyltransferase RsmB [Mitsuaria sp. WAJ17]|nr:16S rRNA (cytosine(967)-C(5))-methyltransferase RsmB [Mitsuaria sp. WAJ17]